MSKRTIIFEGRSKILYEGPHEGTLIQYFKDNIRVPAKKKASKTENKNPKEAATDNTVAMPAKSDDIIFGKGVLNNRISAYLMTQLDEIGVPTHFIKAMNMREQLVWDIDMVPFEVIVRNLASKEMSDRIGIDEGSYLPRSIVEFRLKNEKKGYPVISDEHIIAFGWATQDELEDIYMMAMRINDFLCGLFLGIGFKLVDVRLELGRIYVDNESFMLLGDELSLDNCRLWQMDEKKELQPSSFGKDYNQKIEHFQDIADRLGILPEGQITPDTKVSMELLNRLKTSDDPKPTRPSPVKK